MPSLGNGAGISTEEIDFFKENGFLIKKNLLDKDAASEGLDKAWEYLLDHVPLAKNFKLERSNPNSWFDPQWGDMPPVPQSGFYEGRQPNVFQGTTVKLHDCGNAAFILDFLPNNTAVRTIAHRFLGERLKPIRRTRGVYAIFPSKRNTEPISGMMLGPHADRVCQQLNVCAYLNDVPPETGDSQFIPELTESCIARMIAKQIGHQSRTTWST